MSPLRREREVRGWSQAEVARRIGAPSAVHVSRWERRVVVPSPFYRERFCRLFGRSAEELGFVGSAAADAAPLPAPLTSLIGRKAELARARSLLAGGVRLLTLTGPPGVGKTRLALAVATAAHDRFPDGAVFVSLASLTDPHLVWPAVGQALRLPAGSGVPPLDAVADHLGTRRLLLVLDNFEQVLAAAPLLTDLLAACPRLQVLVTSRASLRIRGEHLLTVAPLPVPDPRRPATPHAVLKSPAAALFVERAQAIHARFALTAAGAPAVAELCRRLDGLPLAIELAAGWTAVLDVQALVERLTRRLPMLEDGPADVPARQRTMRRALGWSYDLLEPAERAVFRRLSVFVGGGSLEAVQSVHERLGGRADEALRLMAGLVNKHLAIRDPGSDEPRFTMLQIVHEYAGEQLEAAGSAEAEAARRAHFDHFADLVSAAAASLRGSEQAVWLGRLERDHDNIRAALRWARGAGDVADALRLATGLWPFWDAHGHSREGRAWLDDLLAAAGGVPDAVRAPALAAAGHMALRSGQYEDAVARYQEGLLLFDVLDDRRGMAGVQNGLATIALRRGEVERAVALFEECLRTYRAIGDRHSTAMLLDNLALAVKQQGGYDRAVALHQESLAIRRAIGDRLGITMTLNNLSEVAFLQGRYDVADAWLAESIAICRQLGAVRWLSFALGLAGRIACIRGDPADASAKLRESLRLGRDIADPLNTADTLESLAMLACREGQMERAARLLGTAAGVRDAMGIPQPATSRAACGPTEAAIRSALGDERYAGVREAGRGMPPDWALAEDR